MEHSFQWEDKNEWQINLERGENVMAENVEYLEMMTKMLLNATFNLIEDIGKIKKELKEADEQIKRLEENLKKLES